MEEVRRASNAAKRSFPRPGPYDRFGGGGGGGGMGNMRGGRGLGSSGFERRYRFDGRYCLKDVQFYLVRARNLYIAG